MFLLFSDQQGYLVLMGCNALSQYVVEMWDGIEEIEHEKLG